MKTAFDIRWSRESKTQYTKIVNYLRAEWSKKEVSNFAQQLQEFEKIVTLFPDLYASVTPEVKRAVLSKHNSVIYQVDQQKRMVKVVTIFDNRQNPSKLKKKK